MKRKDLNILVLKCLGLKKKKSIENLTWDSLGHLTILIELERKKPNKITSIKQISEIYLSGANTRIPLLKNMLSEKLMEPKINQENHNAVIIGGTLLLNEINTAGNNVYSA